MIEQERTEGFDLGPPVIHALGRHLPVPSRVKEDFSLGMLDEKTEHRQPNPFALGSRDTRGLNDAAIVSAKGEVRRYPHLASAQYMNLYLILN